MWVLLTSCGHYCDTISQITWHSPQATGIYIYVSCPLFSTLTEQCLSTVFIGPQGAIVQLSEFLWLCLVTRYLCQLSTFSLAAIAKRYYTLLIHVFSVWIITLHEKIVLINVAAMALQFFIFCVKYLIQSFVGQQWQNNHYTIRYNI